MTAPEASADRARILDRGYRAYEGPRSGIGGAVWSVARHSLRATLGLGRPARHKIFPVASAAIAYVPALVFTGLAVLFDTDLVAEQILTSYSEYYGFIGSAIVVFSALVAPEVLVRDRRDGMLALYLSTPLTRSTYLAAKALAVGLALAIVTLGPPLFLLVAFTVQGGGPDGVAAWASTAGRIVGSGLAVSAAYTAVSLAASSLTDRRAFASVGVILALLGSGAVSEALVAGAGLADAWRMIDLVNMPFELVERIYGEAGGFPELSTASVVAANAGWTLVGLGTVWLRYRRVEAVR
ncbi:MAG: hypothetical protein D6683_10935 [Actinomyces sp.]|nr:MAG: hypothetical protein D6683_10935 [Actinomyces sp.]